MGDLCWTSCRFHLGNLIITNNLRANYLMPTCRGYPYLADLLLCESRGIKEAGGLRGCGILQGVLWQHKSSDRFPTCPNSHRVQMWLCFSVYPGMSKWPLNLNFSVFSVACANLPFVQPRREAFPSMFLGLLEVTCLYASLPTCPNPRLSKPGVPHVQTPAESKNYSQLVQIPNDSNLEIDLHQLVCMLFSPKSRNYAMLGAWHLVVRNAIALCRIVL